MALMRTVTLVDTSVLCHLLQVPGLGTAEEFTAARDELQARMAAGQSFVLPITTIIETGNHIAGIKVGDRRGAAERFVALIRAVRNDTVKGWLVHELAWDAGFLDALCDGASTGEPFVDLAGGGLLGTGDVAILAERDRFRGGRAHLDVGIWTLDAGLAAFA